MRKIWTILACVLGAFALTYCIRMLYIIGADPARAFDAPTPDPEKIRAAQPTPTPVVTLTPEEALERQADADFMKDRVNILLVGFDQSPEREDEGESVYRSKKNNFRSDVLLLLAIDFAKERVHLISIPRDTYTPIYNTRGRWKINAAFAKGGAAEGDGFTYAMKTVELLFGVPVPYYAGVSMTGLKHLVDAMGGVDYDVDIAVHLNGRTLDKGLQHLDGQQVLDYCRVRKGISTDLGRNDRQQRMLLAVFDELKAQKKIAAIPALYESVKDDVYTNLNVAQIAALASFALKLDDESFRRTTLEGEYVHNVYHASYYVLKNKKLIALVEDEFGVTIKRENKYDLSAVKRDKAAEEAARAAESLEDVEAMLTLPADTTGSYEAELLEMARASKQQLEYAIELELSRAEIVRLRHIYERDVSLLLRESGITGGVPDALSTLVAGG